MSDLITIADIVKSPEATRSLMALLGYHFLSPIAKESGSGLSVIIKDNLEQVRQIILRKRKETDNKTNLRVAMEGVRSAAFADSKIAAEYFGGIIANSGSSEDDSLMSFLAIVKNLSSKQLHFHYVIYRSLHNLILANPEWQKINLGLDTDINTLEIFFSTIELNSIGVIPTEDGEMLCRTGIITSYKCDFEKIDEEKNCPITKTSPTTLGFQMYASVHNEYNNWRDLKNLVLEPFPDIGVPNIYFKTREELVSCAKNGI